MVKPSFPLGRSRSSRALGPFHFAALAFALFACMQDPKLELQGPVRLLDRACGGATTECTVTGAAHRTTGLTADSVGYQADGSTEATITIVIPPQSINGYYYDAFHFELLVSGHGDATIADTPRTLPPDYAWIKVDSSYATSDPVRAEMTPKTSIVIKVPQGTTLNVLDVRMISDHTSGC